MTSQGVVHSINVARMKPGARVEVGPALLELTSYADPCRNIAGSFRDRQFVRVSHDRHPGWSRLYARVLAEGTVHIGDALRIAA